MHVVLISPLVALLSTVRTRVSLQLEIPALRHRLVFCRGPKEDESPIGPWTGTCGLPFIASGPSGVRPLVLVKPDTMIGWHRRGFRFYWKWKSRQGLIGRPGTPKEIRALVRGMSSSNVLWGAPRLHGKLLKPGIEVSQATVAKYILKHRKPPLQASPAFIIDTTAELPELG